MPVPIICLDEHVRQFAERFRQEFSKPQYLVIKSVPHSWQRRLEAA